LAPRSIFEIATFTEALPITELVVESAETDLARHLQDETAIGTGDRYDGHRCARVNKAQRRHKIEDGASPFWGNDFSGNRAARSAFFMPARAVLPEKWRPVGKGAKPPRLYQGAGEAPRRNVIGWKADR
jgi:hypothetical protein